MRVPKVKLKHRITGACINVNETDYAHGSLPGIHIGSDWERISETQGTDEGAEEAIKGRALAEAVLAKAPAVEKKAAAKAKK